MLRDLSWRSGAVSLLTMKFIPHSLTPAVRTTEFGVWLGKVVWWTPKPIQYLYLRRLIVARLVQKLFRREPDIRQFD